MKKYTLKLSVIIFAALISQGCEQLDITKTGHPSQRWMFEGPPPRTDGKEYNKLYVEGWIHGCETGTSANSNAWYKFFYKFRQDPYKAQNPKYYKGWKDAFSYCGRYIYQNHRYKGLPYRL